MTLRSGACCCSFATISFPCAEAAHRLKAEDFEPYFNCSKRLLPKPSDLSYFNWETQRSTSNSSPNFQVRAGEHQASTRLAAGQTHARPLPYHSLPFVCRLSRTTRPASCSRTSGTAR